MPDLDADAIAANALQPQSAAADGTQAAQVPIPDQIAADKYRRAAGALAGENLNGGPVSAWGRTRVARAIPEGPV